MSTTEADRHHLIERASEALGREAAMTLAEHLPPTGWGDVATTADLRSVEARIDHRFELMTARIDARFATIDARFEALDARFEDLDRRLDGRFEIVDERLVGFDHKIERFRHEVIGAIHESAVAQTRVFVLAMISTLISVAGIALAAAHLAS